MVLRTGSSSMRPNNQFVFGSEWQNDVKTKMTRFWQHISCWMVKASDKVGNSFKWGDMMRSVFAMAIGYLGKIMLTRQTWSWPWEKCLDYWHIFWTQTYRNLLNLCDCMRLASAFLPLHIPAIQRREYRITSMVTKHERKRNS